MIGETIDARIESLSCRNCDSQDELCEVLSGINESVAGVLSIIHEQSACIEAMHKMLLNLSHTGENKKHASVISTSPKHIFIRGGKENYGRIIGKTGHTIQSLQNYYNVLIDVPKTDQSFDIICIDYSPKNKYHANCAASDVVNILNGESPE